MKRLLIAFIVAAFAICAVAQAQTAEPDYAPWNALLQKYYEPARGMDYARLKASDGQTLQNFRSQLARVNVPALNKKQQLAYWINVYNVNVVATIIENYPTKSIRDISTDPIIRLNVFKKERVPFGNGRISLNDVENDRIRAGFHDPRIHFAINCAARSCPPIRSEAYTGAKLDAQLDDQVRKFLSGPNGIRIEARNGGAVVHVTKILDWFGKDFDQWAGGKVAFLRRYVSPEQQKQLSGNVDFKYDDYNWDLNDRH